MFPGYFGFLRKQLGRLAVREVEQPVARLGVGDDETRAGVAIPHYLNSAKQSVKYPLETVKSVDSFYQNAGRSYTEADFPKSGYMGGGLA
jgi:hypothetical protein